MGTPFLSEIKLISWNYAPKGWAFCNGQTLPINQNQALFALLGTTYGGNGTTTFQLPNLQGRIALHMGSGFTLGQVGGEDTHTLTITELPAHVHNMNAINAPAATSDPTGAFASVPSAALGSVYGGANSLVAMSPLAVANTGGSQPHDNHSPYLVLNYIIALQGIFPSRN